MAKWTPRIAYVDCFAGPGEYVGHEHGSPILALDIARQFIDTGLLKAEQFTLAAIEYKKLYYKNLTECLQRYELAYPQVDAIDSFLRHGAYADVIGEVQQHLQSSRKPPAAFYFIDPFGVSQTPYHLLSGLLASDKSELLFNLMYEEVNRFMESPEFEAPLDAMFGESHWRELRRLSGPERKSQTVQYFKSRLHHAGARYVVTFEMRNDHNSTDYFLFFATKSIKGLAVMKEAMWRVDPTGTFTFSDYTFSLGPMLISPKPDYDVLQSQIRSHFNGKTSVGMEMISEYVLTETSFFRFRNEALKPMIARGDCYVERTPSHPSERLDDSATISFVRRPGTALPLF